MAAGKGEPRRNCSNRNRNCDCNGLAICCCHCCLLLPHHPVEHGRPVAWIPAGRRAGRASFFAGTWMYRRRMRHWLADTRRVAEWACVRGYFFGLLFFVQAKKSDSRTEGARKLSLQIARRAGLSSRSRLFGGHIFLSERKIRCQGFRLLSQPGNFCCGKSHQNRWRRRLPLRYGRSGSLCFSAAAARRPNSLRSDKGASAAAPACDARHALGR